jgi:dTDP-4-dehydrorhamnose reductase
MEKKRMNMGITGANGQLGWELSRILEKGYSEIGALDSRYQDCAVTAVDVGELDITDKAAVVAFAEKIKPALLINCAAMTNVNACESHPAAAMKVNAIGARNMAEAAQLVGAKLIQVSTDYVFAGTAAVPYCEGDVPAPQTVYGKSKLLGERYVETYCHRHFIVRTSWLYGKQGNNFVNTMLRLGAEKEHITVVDDQRGNPTNANDLAHHLLLIGLTEEYGLYHCTGEGECSWYDFAKQIIELRGLPCQVKPCSTEEYAKLVQGQAPRPAYSSLENRMLARTVGNFMRPWETALTSFLK